MKKILLVLVSLSALFYTQAQNAIPNIGFETWNSNPNYDDPAGWGTINGLTYFLGVRTVTKATATADVHSGSYAMKLQSKTVPLQGVAPGIAATGTINPNTQAVDGGVPYTKRPISLTGWYKYIPNGVDTGSVYVTLWKFVSGVRVQIGTAEAQMTSNVTTYTQFTANVTYTSANFPDSMAITILTSSGANASPDGTQMWVDDLAFVLCNNFSATAAATATATCTSANGGANVTSANGAGGNVYQWSNSASTSSITAAAGTYNVTVTDGNGCSATSSAAITATTTAINPSATSTNTTCTASLGTATATAGSGTSPYTYHWSNNATTAVINNVAGGAYQVTITDANGCTGTATTTVGTTTATITPNITSTTTSCASNTGSATVAPTGGTAAYTYNWNNSGTTASITNIGAGSYQVTITDANGCSATASTSVTTPNGPSATQVTTNVTCHGAANGAVDVTTTGGTGTITYTWNTSASTEDLSGLSGGTYTVTINDANNCSFTLSAVVAEPAVLTATTTHTNVTCNGANDGTVKIIVAGGTGPYTYFDNPVPSGTTTFPNLAAGNYVGTLTDANSCTAAVSETIIEPAVLTTALTTTDASSSTATDGSITVNNTGGTAPYTITWSSGNGTNLAAGTYTVTVTDANNCTTTASATVSFASGIASVDMQHVKLYPNPANNQLIIETGTTDGKFNLAIYSIDGKVVNEKQFVGEKVTVDLKQLPVGFYSYQLKNITSGNVSFGKLQIQR